MIKKIIFIDDDELIRKSWEMVASEKGIELQTFASIDDFLTQNFPKDITIYIDSNLGNGLKGEVESERLFKAGYSELFIATAHDPDSIDKPTWIKDIVGKRFPY